eukprot:CAMPEP_0173451634 /NCGR_PEP_ID=MMETSP1357-20121228/47148_1 /TAXON_ID=77926 /ORGANISM="Hemiselmis rufescens, Strain PCC563" /LENGTH=190 /DNA_ID=CAMNT_0014418413 /DNA_START=54 /DNA_END=626 /DNA_ORIENTATION=+
MLRECEEASAALKEERRALSSTRKKGQVQAEQEREEAFKQRTHELKTMGAPPTPSGKGRSLIAGAASQVHDFEEYKGVTDRHLVRLLGEDGLVMLRAGSGIQKGEWIGDPGRMKKVRERMVSGTQQPHVKHNVCIKGANQYQCHVNLRESEHGKDPPRMKTEHAAAKGYLYNTSVYQRAMSIGKKVEIYK